MKKPARNLESTSSAKAHASEDFPAYVDAARVGFNERLPSRRGKDSLIGPTGEGLWILLGTGGAYIPAM